MNDILSGLRILILEDESLIAMDVEQLCRDHGASDIIVKRDLSGLESDGVLDSFDVAIIDLMLSGVSAVPFAQRLRDLNRPFLFTTGLADAAVTSAFPGIQAIGKPYAGAELVRAIAAAAGRS
jgi:DNA-binding response OmpR family regulator